MSSTDFLYLLAKNRWTLIKVVFPTTILFLIISLLLPKYYLASASIIPVGNEGGGISSLLGGYSLNVLGKDVIIPESYRVILDSRELKDSLAQKFNLFEIYGAEYKEQYYKELANNFTVEIDKEVGIGYSPIVAIKLSILDKSPQRSAEMVNFIIDYFQNRTFELNNKFAEKKFTFVESRYNENIGELAKAQANLKEFQEKFGIYQLDEQLKLIVGNLAQLEAEKENIELKLSFLRQTGSSNSPEANQLQLSKQVISRRLNELRTDTVIRENSGEIFLPAKILPDLGMRYVDLYRDVQVQNKIYEMLTIEYEQNRIQLNKTIPSSLVLDYAEIPTYKAKPKRLLIVLAGFFISLFLSIAILVFNDYLLREKEKNSENYRKLSEIWQMIRNDFRRSQKG